MLQTFTVEPRTLVLLQKLQSIKKIESLVLVGGTALALHIGHRHSIDLDLFGKHDLDFDNMVKLIENESIEVNSRYQTKSIFAITCDTIKVDIVHFDKTWIKPILTENGIRLASMEDIVAMKLNAIAGRGSKKDFVDLYFLLNYFSLQEMITFFQKKFPEIALFMILKSMTYFIDADTQAMPKMLIPTQWENVKTKIIDEIKKYKTTK